MDTSKVSNVGKIVVGHFQITRDLQLELYNIAGNFVTDAMVWAYRNNQEKTICLAIINSGGIKVW